jgi:hypothetical protein
LIQKLKISSDLKKGVLFFLYIILKKDHCIFDRIQFAYSERTCVQIEFFRGLWRLVLKGQVRSSNYLHLFVGNYALDARRLEIAQAIDISQCLRGALVKVFN